MELKRQIEAALKDAMRRKDEVRRNAIRMLLTAIKNKEKELRRELADSELQQVLSTAVKQRREAVEQYRQGQRIDLAEEEEKEIAVLQEFMPQPLSRAELEQLVAEAITKTGATSAKDMGRVMKAVMPKVAGRADGKEVNALVRAKLAG